MAETGIAPRHFQASSKEPRAVDMGTVTVIATIFSFLGALRLYRNRAFSGTENTDGLCNCANRYGPQQVTGGRDVKCRICGKEICPSPGQGQEFFLRCTLISFYTASIMILVALPTLITLARFEMYWPFAVYLILGFVVFRLICSYTPVGRWHDLVNARLDAIDQIRGKESWSKFKSRNTGQFSELSRDEKSQIKQAVVANSIFRRDPVNEVLSGVGTMIYGGVLILGALFLMSSLHLLPDEYVLARYILLWYGAWSLFTFAAMYYDKSMASKGSGSRVAEQQLHFFEMMGGFPGSLAAQWIFRHKVRKFSYQVVFYMIATVHLSAWSWLVIRYH